MRVSVHYQGLRDLESDMRGIPRRLYIEGAKVIREAARDGGTTARRIAKWTAGTHGRHYPSSITWDRTAAAALGEDGGSITASYGPDSSKPQGGMSFEFGSRNQKPHNDLANSADLIRPALYRNVDSLLDRLFWPDE